MTDDRDARPITLHVRCPICHKEVDSILLGDTWGDCIPGDTGCANITVHDDAMGEHIRSEHTAQEMTEVRRLYAERWAEVDPEGDWYVDATDAGPDAERVEALAKAMRRSTCTDPGTEVLDLLRAEGWDLVKREDGESQ